MIKIESLHIYPIKSLGGIELSESKVTARGLEHDRRWVLVDEKNKFITQREHSELALLQPELKEGKMLIHDRANKQGTLSLSLEEPNTQSEDVNIWDDIVPAKAVSIEADKWFSDYLGADIRLMFMHEHSIRQADQRYAITEDDKVSFADGYPILIISEASMEHLNSKLEESLSISRFRANIIVSGAQAHEEDSWREIRAQKQTLYGVKPCARCVMTTIDPDTAVYGKEPLRTLNRYRKVGNKILFGENFIPKEEGLLKVGDDFQIIATKETVI